MPGYEKQAKNKPVSPTLNLQR